MIGDFGTKEPECFVYDLERFLDDPNFEILDLDCDVNSNEIFILTSTKRLLRLSKSPAKVSLIYPEETSPNGLNLFSSFTEAAHRSTNMFEKFKKTDEFERLKQFNFRKFGIPSQLSNVTEQLKGTIDLKNTPNIEQTGKTLASNLFSFIDNIKSSALATELPQSAQNLFSSQFASSPSSQSSSPPSRIFETNNQLIDVPESSSSRENSQAENEFLEKLENHQTSQTADVSVNRKKKTAMKKKFLPKVVENVEEITVAGNSSITNENVIEEENMEKCLRLLGMINEPEETKQEIDDTGVLRTETSGEILIDQVEETSSVL
uniref:Uncharacterized protein n=1 Tax=Acrobeloides nanus TaxID=290746 RepID=A0A914CSX3_9BILA